MHGAQCCRPSPSMIRLPSLSRGEPSTTRGRRLLHRRRRARDDHDPAHAARPVAAFDRFPPGHQRRRVERRLLRDRPSSTRRPTQPLICAYGLPDDEYASTAASTTAESRSALVASPGLAVWTAPSAPLKASADSRPVVKIDDGAFARRSATDRGLLLVADERRSRRARATPTRSGCVTR
jgi:hypothetical protein